MKAYDTFGRLLTSEEGYEHVQSTPASTWTVQHDLGYKPSAIEIYVDGRSRLASKRVIDNDRLEVSFNANVSGTVKVK